MVKKKRQPRSEGKKRLRREDRPKGRFGNHFMREWQQATPNAKEGGTESVNYSDIEEILRSKDIPLKYNNVSKVVNGDIRYTQRTLEALAAVYGVDPWVLLSRAPNQSDGTTEMLRLWAQFPAEYRQEAIKTLQALVNVINADRRIPTSRRPEKRKPDV